MPQNYVPIFWFLAVVGVLIPLTLVLARIVRTQNPHKSKLMPYECGIDPVDNARGRYTVRYYIIAILFVVFDVETIFLFPWAVKFKLFGVFGLVEMLIALRVSPADQAIAPVLCMAVIGAAEVIDFDIIAASKSNRRVTFCGVRETRGVAISASILIL